MKLYFYRDLEEEVEIKSQRNLLLENILKRNNIKAPEEKHKDKQSYSKKLTEKLYVPYSMENFENNGKDILLHLKRRKRQYSYITP